MEEKLFIYLNHLKTRYFNAVRFNNRSVDLEELKGELVAYFNLKEVKK